MKYYEVWLSKPIAEPNSFSNQTRYVVFASSFDLAAAKAVAANKGAITGYEVKTVALLGDVLT